MSLSANALYRSVALSWNNYDASGSEYVQVFAKPSGGSWSLVLTVPVSGLDQTATWDTALPLTAYEIAMRFVNATVPTVGYEGTDPDLWTAATAAQSKTTVTTTSADVTSFTGSFVSSASPVALAWVSAQMGVSYLLEKNLGAGWVTVATVAGTSYPYTVPAAELNTTVQFRVTAKNGAVTGTPVTLGVTMAIVVGTPAWVSAVFSATTRQATLTWSAATNATAYEIYKSTDGGGSYSLVASPTGVSYVYSVPDGEINTTVKFKVRGTQGATAGAYSTVQDLAMTLVVGATVVTAASWTPTSCIVSFNLTAAANATAYECQWSLDGVTWNADGYTPYLYRTYQVTAAQVNQTLYERARGVNGSVVGPWSAAASIATTVTIGAPSAPTYLGSGAISWTPASGDVANQVVQQSSDGVTWDMVNFYANGIGSGAVDTSGARRYIRVAGYTSSFIVFVPGPATFVPVW
jgi:hypothetical protein